ncbi:hypothetical protein [Limosilactobacillus allomucosae]|uniref:Uncharacterized protein n=1 Tax=Limosilactobacillus allomucosae TaxID=3142938 RepID=A0AAU7C189_9LACO
MVEFFLVANTSDEVTYKMVNADLNEVIGNITVNKKTKDYKLDYAEEMTTHYESATYKFILGAIERDNYPKFAFDGWC